MRNEDTGYIYKSFINRRDKHRSEKAVDVITSRTVSSETKVISKVLISF